MIGVFVGLYILALFWYLQVSNYIRHVLAVTSPVYVISLVMMIIGGIAAVFLDVSFWRGVFLPFVVFDILIVVCHLILIFYPKHITKKDKSNPRVEFEGLGTGGSILAISLALVCTSFSFALSNPSGLASLKPFTANDQGILFLLNSYIFTMAVLVTIFMLIWLRFKPDTS